MLIRQACGVKKTHPFDDFPHYTDTSRKADKTPTAAEVRANFRAYMEALKVNGSKT